MTVGEKLKELRVSKNLTQVEASFLYGCSRQYLNGVEKGHIKLGTNAIRKFANLYNVNPTVLSKLAVRGESNANKTSSN